jgi:hypothetical protein
VDASKPCFSSTPRRGPRPRPTYVGTTYDGSAELVDTTLEHGLSDRAYIAFTSQHKQLSFQSTDGATITSFSASFSAQCPDASRNFSWTWSPGANLEVTMQRTASISGTLSDGTIGSLSFSFDAAGFVTGTMSFQKIPAVDAQGNKVLCDSGTITFSGGP